MLPISNRFNSVTSSPLYKTLSSKFKILKYFELFFLYLILEFLSSFFRGVILPNNVNHGDCLVF